MHASRTACRKALPSADLDSEDFLTVNGNSGQVPSPLIVEKFVKKNWKCNQYVFQVLQKLSGKVLEYAGPWAVSLCGAPSLPDVEFSTKLFPFLWYNFLDYSCTYTYLHYICYFIVSFVHGVWNFDLRRSGKNTEHITNINKFLDENALPHQSLIFLRGRGSLRFKVTVIQLIFIIAQVDIFLDITDFVSLHGVIPNTKQLLKLLFHCPQNCQIPNTEISFIPFFVSSILFVPRMLKSVSVG